MGVSIVVVDFYGYFLPVTIPCVLIAVIGVEVSEYGVPGLVR